MGSVQGKIKDFDTVIINGNHGKNPRGLTPRGPSLFICNSIR
jgi:hypothetical protein